MISFIVPVKDGLAYTRALVETIRAGNPDSQVEWVIVDSGSTDGTLEYCREIAARVVPFSRQPFSYCAAVNAGAAQACGDLWLIANNDLEFRSEGDLKRIERLFRDWPVLGALSPGRPTGDGEIEFRLGGLNGACWVVRPELFRAWGGMPEEMTGYGYDEVWTHIQLWRRARAFAWLTGWEVLHHGSATFGPLAGNTTPAMRRNLRRLLEAVDGVDLVDVGGPQQTLDRLYKRERERAPATLLIPAHWEPYITLHGYANVKVAGLEAGETNGCATGEQPARLASPMAEVPDRQYLPWLANELLLQPDAGIVGANAVYAIRPGPEREALNPEHTLALIGQAQAVGPPAPPVMPEIPEKRPTFRQRVSAWLHDWRHRKDALPEAW